MLYCTMWHFSCLSVCLIYLSNLSICLSIYLYLSIFLSLYLSIYFSVCLSIFLSIYLSLSLSVCLSLYLYICLFVYIRICILSFYAHVCFCLFLYTYIHLSVYIYTYFCRNFNNAVFKTLGTRIYLPTYISVHIFVCQSVCIQLYITGLILCNPSPLSMCVCSDTDSACRLILHLGFPVTLCVHFRVPLGAQPLKVSSTCSPTCYHPLFSKMYSVLLI